MWRNKRSPPLHLSLFSQQESSMRYRRCRRPNQITLSSYSQSVCPSCKPNRNSSTQNTLGGPANRLYMREAACRKSLYRTAVRDQSTENVGAENAGPNYPLVTLELRGVTHSVTWHLTHHPILIWRPLYRNPCEYPHKLESLRPNYILSADSMDLLSFVTKVCVVGSEMHVYNVIESFRVIQGHPRSIIFASIENAYATSHYWSIATLVLSCTVSEIRRLKGRKYCPFVSISVLFNAIARGGPFRTLWWSNLRRNSVDGAIVVHDTIPEFDRQTDGRTGGRVDGHLDLSTTSACIQTPKPPS